MIVYYRFHLGNGGSQFPSFWKTDDIASYTMIFFGLWACSAKLKRKSRSCSQFFVSQTCLDKINFSSVLSQKRKKGRRRRNLLALIVKISGLLFPTLTNKRFYLFLTYYLWTVFLKLSQTCSYLHNMGTLKCICVFD